MPRDLKRVKEYMELGYEKEDAIKMVDEEMEKEPKVEPVVNDDKKDDGSITLTHEELAKIIQEQIQKNNLSKEGAKPEDEPTLEDSFKNLLG
jgi:hypothetical protein